MKTSLARRKKEGERRTESIFIKTTPTLKRRYIDLCDHYDLSYPDMLEVLVNQAEKVSVDNNDSVKQQEEK